MEQENIEKSGLLFCGNNEEGEAEYIGTDLEWAKLNELELETLKK